MAAATEPIRNLRSPTVHGTAIAAGGKAALIRGPSGSGKSDLALRCLCAAPCQLLTQVARLIADDQVHLHRDGDQIVLSSPPAISGQIEVRGLGIVAVLFTTNIPLRLVVDLVPARYALDRMPEPATVVISGITFPRIMLHPFEGSAAIKLLLALSLQG